MARPALTARRIIEAAAELADDTGLDRLTMAAVAQRLGVRQPSLYNHIGGLPALLHALTIDAKRALADTVAWATIGKSGPEALRSLAIEYRRWALRHPGRYAATAPAPAPTDDEDSEASGLVLQVFHRVLHGFGLHEEEELVPAHRALRASLHGFVSGEVAGVFGVPVAAATSYDSLIDLHGAWFVQRAVVLSAAGEQGQP
jgi:AcrR family transcriptional regulator